MSIVVPSTIIKQTLVTRMDKNCGQWLRTVVLGVAVVFFSLCVSESAFAGSLPPQETFPTAQQAVDAFVAAERIDNRHELLRILGSGGAKLIFSGDRVADRDERQKFVAAYDDAHHVDTENADTAVLVVGKEEWSFPIPVVKQDDVWHFDTDAGLQNILDRRVGRNELNVIEVCRAYIDAQHEYASKNHLSDGTPEYAQKFKSTSGKHDGLYWEAKAGEDESPFGPLVANARAEGYDGEHQKGHHKPYHGYFYKILTRQGTNAPGGAKDYIVNGHMTAGFALLAFPAKWGDSGVMTFIVDQDGIVFEKNLGSETATIARQITAFDPDLSWKAP